jgi:hypothetical protein
VVFRIFLKGSTYRDRDRLRETEKKGIEFLFYFSCCRSWGTAGGRKLAVYFFCSKPRPEQRGESFLFRFVYTDLREIGRVLCYCFRKNMSCWPRDKQRDFGSVLRLLAEKTDEESFAGPTAVRER